MKAGGGAAAPPAILVVDDDLYLLAAIKQTLTLNGYAATTCGNPLEALARLGDQPFAAVLADIRMPEMNGMVLLERILERVQINAAVLGGGNADHLIPDHRGACGICAMCRIGHNDLAALGIAAQIVISLNQEQTCVFAVRSCCRLKSHRVHARDLA